MSDCQRIVFMGSPDFCLPTLSMLHGYSNVVLEAVITQPDKPKGRGKVMSPTPVRQWAIDHHIEVHSPETKSALTDLVVTLNPDLIFVVAYGMILPPAITDQYLCINGHASILPKYRGASPIHAALLNNDTETGVTLIHMNTKMDEGDMVLTRKLSITQEDNFQTLHDKLANCCSEAILSYLEKSIEGVPQDHAKATYCAKFTTADRELLSSDSLDKKWGKIRAFSPKPGAFIKVDGLAVKVLKATQSAGQLLPFMVQPPGKKPMSYEDYCRGGYPELLL